MLWFSIRILSDKLKNFPPLSLTTNKKKKPLVTRSHAGCLPLIVVSIPPRELRAYIVSRDIAIKVLLSNMTCVHWQSYIWRRGLQITRRKPNPKKRISATKTSKHLGEQNLEEKRRKEGTKTSKRTQKHSRQDHVIDKKPCQIRQAKKEPKKTHRIRHKSIQRRKITKDRVI